MSEMHIRINKRVFERTIYWIIIIALVGVWMFADGPATTTGNVTEEYTELQEQVDALTAENTELQEQVDTLTSEKSSLETQLDEVQTQPEPEPVVEAEPEPEPEPEPELSGEIEFDWDIDMDGNSLEQVSFTVTNGKSSTEEITYKLTWEGLQEDLVFKKGTFNVRSGESEQVTIDDFLRNPGSSSDTLKLRFTDSSGALLELLDQEVL